MPCGHHGGVMLVVVRGVPKIDHFHIWVLHHSFISLLCNDKVRMSLLKTSVRPERYMIITIIHSAHHFAVVLEVVLRIDKQDVLWFQVCVCQLVAVHN